MSPSRPDRRKQENAPPKTAADSEKFWTWLDEDGIRCGPRHQTLKAALNYRKNWTVDSSQTWVHNREKGKAELVDIDRTKYPSMKEPKTLKVGDYNLRDLSEEEQSKVNTIMQFIEDGYV
jgi:hypothetical protein